jgi:hypothetical protein
MIKYMPSNSEATCIAVSEAIYQLTRPLGANDTTKYAFGWSKDKHDMWFMHFDLDMILPVHADRGDMLEQVLSFFVQANQLSEQSKQAILDLAAEREGQTVTLQEVIPVEWLGFLQDNIELEEQQWA